MDFIPPDVAERLESEMGQDGFTVISGDLGVLLIDECYCRFGKLIPSL